VLVIVSFGGVYLAFPDTIRVMVDAVLPPVRDLRSEAAAIKVEPVKGDEPLDIDGAIVVAQATFPESRVNLVFLPAKPDQPYRISLLRAGQDRHSAPVMVLVNPWTHRMTGVFDPLDFNAGEAFLASQHALHSGQGCGLVWRVLVFVSGLFPALFAATGIAMWLKRRRSVARVLPLVDQSQTARRAGE
jgi:uncharacterized iron-regulated membrane protein